MGQELTRVLCPECGTLGEADPGLSRLQCAECGNGYFLRRCSACTRVSYVDGLQGIRMPWPCTWCGHFNPGFSQNQDPAEATAAELAAELNRPAPLSAALAASAQAGPGPTARGGPPADLATPPAGVGGPPADRDGPVDAGPTAAGGPAPARGGAEDPGPLLAAGAAIPGPAVPGPTAVPEPTLRPKPATSPESTAMPRSATAPERATIPEPGATPETTAMPKPTPGPESTAIPEPTAMPQPAAAPKLTAMPWPATMPQPAAMPELVAMPQPAPEPAAWPPATGTPAARRRRARRVGFSVAAVVASAAAAAALLTTGQRPTAGMLTARAVMTRAVLFTASRVASVDFQGVPGQLVIAGTGSGQLTLSGQVRANGTPSVETRLDRATGALTVSVRCPSAVACTQDLRLVVPGNASTTVRQPSGRVVATGLAGPLAVTAANAEVSVSGLRSDSLTAAITNGRLSAAFSVPPRQVAVSLASAQATIRLPASAAYRVTGKFSSGFLRVAVPQASDADRTVTVHVKSSELELLPA